MGAVLVNFYDLDRAFHAWTGGRLVAPSITATPHVAGDGSDAGGAALLPVVQELSADRPSAHTQAEPGALIRLDRHAREFSHSALAHARGVARVRALCRLGQLDEARAEAGRLAGDDGLVREALAGTCVGEN